MNKKGVFPFALAAGAVAIILLFIWGLAFIGSLDDIFQVLGIFMVLGGLAVAVLQNKFDNKVLWVIGIGIGMILFGVFTGFFDGFGLFELMQVPQQ